jgi:hypothetical protein
VEYPTPPHHQPLGLVVTQMPSAVIVAGGGCGEVKAGRISGRRPSAPTCPWPWHRGSSATACSKPRRVRRRGAARCDLCGSRGRRRWSCRSKGRDALVGIPGSPRGTCIPSPRARWKQPRSRRCMRPASGRRPSAQACRGHRSRPPVEMIGSALEPGGEVQNLVPCAGELT